MESYGFVYSDYLTKLVRGTARKEQHQNIASPVEGKTYNAQHVWGTLNVFINPAVASLPQHQHLFAEEACFKDYGKPNRRCGEGRAGENESPMDPAFLPLELSEAMDKEWETLVKKNIENPRKD